MKIARVSISNYRNIDGISIDLDKDSNYIIGENNIGKSNFLALLEKVCNGWGFDEQDYADSEKPIEIQLKIQLLPCEQGFFGDNFSSEDASIINIKYVQGISDAHPDIICTDTNESIQVKQIKKLHFLLDIFENRQLRQAMEYVNSNVIISTVHGAKGLEWEYIFLVDLERWVFPSFLCSSCSERFTAPTKCRCRLPNSISEEFYNPLIEELSVFYVGITRARKQVYVSASQVRINAQNEPKNSCFSCMANLDGIKLIQAK